jgi:alpha-L-glutamate ligase-like protein
MLSLFRGLRQAGVLGINRRNGDYVLRYNQRRHYPLVDNKLATKQLAMQHQIATPQLYAEIRSEHDILKLPELLSEHSAFALKPAHGVGGDGIVVVTGKMHEFWRKANGTLLTMTELAYHTSNILSGLHSLGGQPDHAMIEYCVDIEPVFADISYYGVPDIRIIVLLGYPAMAMVRLPTRMSDGKANLHQGAIGAGVDLTTGTTLGGVWHNDTIDQHPDTFNHINGITITQWDDILTTAARCYDITGLGYLGVDMVLDRHYGPLMLELNARPGLNIQLANRTGLLKRLTAIERHVAQLGGDTEPVATRVAFSKDPTFASAA